MLIYYNVSCPGLTTYVIPGWGKNKKNMYCVTLTVNLQCCTLFLKTESFKYILSKYWLSTIVFSESWPVLIHSSSLLIKGSVFWKYSILEVDLCISVSHYLVHNRRPKMNFLGKLSNAGNSYYYSFFLTFSWKNKLLIEMRLMM